MKKIVIAMMVVAALAAVAHAESKPAPEKVENDVVLMASLTEVEPNDTAATANAIAGGDVYAAAISPVGDADWFVFTSAGGAASFETGAGAAPAVGDTKIYVYASDGTTQLAYDDDAGVGYYSLVTYTFAAGTYYVKVVGYNATSYSGNYTLTCAAAAPPAVNDLCAGAIDVQDQSLASWTINLNSAGGYSNNYSLPTTGSCTGYSTPGPDAVYRINLAAGEAIMVSEAGACDMALWLATDCANLLTTCVAGADAGLTGGTESISYTAANAGTYYLVVDTYTSSGCPVTVTINAPVPQDEASFGTIKAMFR
jgi:hypothetical protein